MGTLKTLRRTALYSTAGCFNSRYVSMICRLIWCGGNKLWLNCFLMFFPKQLWSWMRFSILPRNSLCSIMMSWFLLVPARVPVIVSLLFFFIFLTKGLCSVPSWFAGSSCSGSGAELISLLFFFSPTATLAMGSLAQNSSGAIGCSCNTRFRRRFRRVPEGSGADCWWGFGEFRGRLLMRFRRVPVQFRRIPGQMAKNLPRSSKLLGITHEFILQGKVGANKFWSRPFPKPPWRHGLLLFGVYAGVIWTFWHLFCWE